MNDSDEDLEQRVRSTLDSGVTNLDAATRRRLAEMRAQAFEHKPFWSRWFPVENWIPVASFATVIVLAVTLFFVLPGQPTQVQLAQQDGDMALEVLFSDDEHEDLSDPDFYAWLDMTLLEDEETNHAG
jgi:hypothetical protein